MKITAQDVVDIIVKTVPEGVREDTADTFKSGDPSQEVTGIVTTFLATCEVIRKAIDLGANFIITHEPTFYDNRDKVDWLGDDSVYAFKRRLIEDNNIVIWRFHDYWHRHRPDGIKIGFMKQLGWEPYTDTERGNLFVIPPRPLSELIAELKEKLHMNSMRAVGDPAMICARVGLREGFGGNSRGQIEFLNKGNLDVLICGETTEWTTCEYVRDAVLAGENKALIVAGHANTEEPGMKWLVEWLSPRVPGVKITHVPAGDPFNL